MMFDLAARLKKSVEEIEAMPAPLFDEWIAYFGVKSEYEKQAMGKG